MRRNFRGGVRLKHLSQSGYFTSGNPRFYFRPKGQPGVSMPDAAVDSDEFLTAYVHASGLRPKPKPKSFDEGSLGAGITVYLASENYLGMAFSSRERWRSRCDDIRLKYGLAKLEGLSARHIKKDLASFEGHAANNRLKVWRSLCAYWDQVGLIETNVARLVAPRKTPKTDGHMAWSREDFATYRAFWPIGTKQRLTFELLYRTCAAIGDVTRLHRGMIKDGWLTYTRQKSGSVATCPFDMDGPIWFEATSDLAECLAVGPRHLTFLTTVSGKSRSPKSVATWFSKSASQAGIEKGKTAHGVRKGRAAIFKENGALAEQRMAILGHETISETQHYSKSADLKRTIEGTEKFQLSERVPTSGNQAFKTKGNRHDR